MRRALWLLALAGCAAPPAPVAKAVDFLLSRQSPDGLWRSETTTLLGSGQALTPFVLYALSHAPADVLSRQRAAIDRALDRLPVAGDEYPAYSLALSILALRRLRPSADVEPLVRALRAQRDPESGGWGRPDVSTTAFAVEALGVDEPARRFAERCRAPGGGFVFTPAKTWAHLNKAGEKGYETATLDALRVLGGFEEAPPPREEWREGLFFYRAFARTKVRPDASTAAAVAARQNADGSFKNPNGLMKEDDPLVATGLALVALCLSP
jgi:hypothetical protein